DLITCLDTLPHRAVDEVELVQSVAQSLAPNGYFLLLVPAFQWLYGHHDETAHIQRRYSIDDIRALLTPAGFIIQRYTYANACLLPAYIGVCALEKIKTRLNKAPQAVTTYSHPLPTPINTLLKTILRMEALLVKAGVNFPAGISLAVLARKQPVS